MDDSKIIEMPDNKSPIKLLRDCAVQDHGMAMLRDSLDVGLESGWQQRCLDMVADMVDAELERAYMRLPLDADGVPIKPGDTLYEGTREIPGKYVYAVSEKRVCIWHYGDAACITCVYADNFTHVKPDPVKNLLQELADEVWEASCESQTTWSDSGLDGIAERYAERIRKVCHEGCMD